MLPPPETSYESLEELMRNVNSFAFSQGYAVTKLRSDLKNNTVILKCDRGGIYRERTPRQLNVAGQPSRCTGSRLTGCKFQLYGRLLHSDKRWHLTVVNAEHNHEPSDNMAGHSVARRLTLNQRRRTSEMLSAGVAPRRILSTLGHQGEGFQAIAKTIYNEKTRLRKAELGDRPPLIALIHSLGEANYRFHYECNSDDQLIQLFFAHPRSVELAVKYPFILVMDCTYKTNRFRMPMLHVIGMTSFNTSFTVAVAFLKEETEPYYRWALEQVANLYGTTKPLVITTDRELALMNAVDFTFPTSKHLLCVWHIQKNTLARCKKYFASSGDWDQFQKAWTKVIYSSSEQIFTAQWESFCQTYDSVPAVLTYIANVWMPYKERFVAAYTNQYLHFGNVNSSRAEGHHARIKAYLTVSNNDLREVQIRLSDAIENEANAIAAQVAMERTRIFHHLDQPFYCNVLRRVSVYALNKIHEQYLKALRMMSSDGVESSPCEDYFSKTMGLPCARRVSEMLAFDRVLALDKYILYGIS